jgi:hypothetical protein
MLGQSTRSVSRYAALGKEILPDPDLQPHGRRGAKRLMLGAAEDPPEERLARFLGLFSLALGTLELLAPRTLARAIGMRGHRLLPILGLREIASGLGILAGRRPAAPVWSRVAGDAMDLAIIGALLTATPRRHRTAVAGIAVLGVTLLDLLCARQLSGPPTQLGRPRLASSDASAERPTIH